MCTVKVLIVFAGLPSDLSSCSYIKEPESPKQQPSRHHGKRINGVNNTLNELACEIVCFQLCSV